MTERHDQDAAPTSADPGGATKAVAVDQFLDSLADALAARMAPRIAAEIRRKLTQQGPEEAVSAALDETAVASKLPKRIKSI